MEQLKKTLKEKVATKTKLVKELKGGGNKKRAFVIYKEVQEHKKELTQIASFNKTK